MCMCMSTQHTAKNSGVIHHGGACIVRTMHKTKTNPAEYVKSTVGTQVKVKMKPADITGHTPAYPALGPTRPRCGRGGASALSAL